jgi:hypothetical protein
MEKFKKAQAITHTGRKASGENMADEDFWVRIICSMRLH